ASKRRAVFVDNGRTATVDRHEFDQWFMKYEKDMATRFAMAKALRRRFEPAVSRGGGGVSFGGIHGSATLSALDISAPIIPLTDRNTSIFAARQDHEGDDEDGDEVDDEEEEEEDDGEEEGEGEDEEDEGDEEVEEGDTDSRFGFDFQNMGLDDVQSLHSFDYAHPSSVSLLGHEGDGRPIEQVYSTPSPPTVTTATTSILRSVSNPIITAPTPIPLGDYAYSAMGGADGKLPLRPPVPPTRPTLQIAEAYRILGHNNDAETRPVSMASVVLSPMSISMAQREEDVLRTSRHFKMFIASRSRFSS
ncbi:hypothetical protein FRC17_000557, partial [Serendipita sp. 399]